MAQARPRTRIPLWSVVHGQHSVTVSTSASVRFQHALGAHVPVALWVECGQLSCSVGEMRVAQPHKGASRAAVSCTRLLSPCLRTAMPSAQVLV